YSARCTFHQHLPPAGACLDFISADRTRISSGPASACASFCDHFPRRLHIPKFRNIKSYMKRDSRLSSVLHALLHMAAHDAPMTSEVLARCMGTNPVVVRR